MRFMIKYTWNQQPTAEIMALMPAEIKRGMELFEQGIAEAAYQTADQTAWAAWAIWNCESHDALQDVLKTLPMHDFFNFEITELAPAFNA